MSKIFHRAKLASTDVGKYLKVSAIHPNGSLRQWQTAGKAEVQRPDAWMLSNRKSPEGTVKCLATSCYLTLRHKEVAVIKPYSRHLKTKKQMNSVRNNS